jgi:hypothetical protein
LAESYIELTAGSGTKAHSVTTVIGANTVHDEIHKAGLPYLATYMAAASTVSTATANSHLIQIMAGSSLNVYVLRIRVWQDVIATTAALVRLGLVRLSTAGTGGTSVTPALLDTSDSASGATAMTLPSSKGTETTFLSVAGVPFVQAVGTTGGPSNELVDWDFRDGLVKPIRIPAGTANGLALKNLAAVAGASVAIEVSLLEANF